MILTREWKKRPERNIQTGKCKQPKIAKNIPFFDNSFAYKKKGFMYF